MKLRAGRSTLCSAVAVLVLTVICVAPAEASTAAESPTAQLRQFWTDNGVDPATVDALITKFLETGSVDSLSGTVQPERVKTVVSNGVKASVRVYPDGSVVTTSQEVETTSHARSIAGCTVVSGSGYRQFKNCRVAGDNGIVGLGFYATYTLVQGAYDNIGAYSGAGATCSFGSCSNPSWARAKAHEDSAGKAIVTEQVTYTSVAGSTTTNQLSLLVGADSATSTFQ